MAHRRMQRRDDAGPHAALLNALGLRELAVGNLWRSKVCRLWVVDGMLKVLLLRVSKEGCWAARPRRKGESIARISCAL